jgi:anti-sigma factor RsiW
MTAPLTCRDCRALLPVYLDRDLPRPDRSNVAAHLESCARCRAEYARQRDLQAGLRADLPGLGRLEPSRASVLWQAVQGELHTPRRVAWPISQRRMSALVALLALALVLPWLLSPERLSALSLPLPPTPAVLDGQVTDAPASADTTAAVPIALQITPPSRPEYAPTQAAAQTVPPEPAPRLSIQTQAR